MRRYLSRAGNLRRVVEVFPVQKSLDAERSPLNQEVGRERQDCQDYRYQTWDQDAPAVQPRVQVPRLRGQKHLIAFISR